MAPVPPKKHFFPYLQGVPGLQFLKCTYRENRGISRRKLLLGRSLKFSPEFRNRADGEARGEDRAIVTATDRWKTGRKKGQEMAKPAGIGAELINFS
jgi:hypothetical protein